MKIDIPPLRPQVIGTASKESSSKTPRAGDTLQAETSVALLQRDLVAGIGDIDLQRVADLKAAIQEGRLNIRSERIAESLIASIREMLDK